MKRALNIILFIILLITISSILWRSYISKPKERTTGIMSGAMSERNGANEKIFPYSDEIAKQLLSDGKKVILYFYDAENKASVRSVEEIIAHKDTLPTNVVVLQVDFYSAQDLRKKYNVLAPDTFVLIDQSYNAVTQWESGGEGVKAIIDHID